MARENTPYLKMASDWFFSQDENIYRENEKMKKIISMKLEGKSCAGICSEAGVSSKTVWNYINRVIISYERQLRSQRRKNKSLPPCKSACPGFDKADECTEYFECIVYRKWLRGEMESIRTLFGKGNSESCKNAERKS